MRGRLSLLFLLVVAASSTVTAQTGPWDIGVDVGAAGGVPSVTPSKPIVRIGDDDLITVQILVGGKIPAEDHARLRFPQQVLDLTLSGGKLTLIQRLSKLDGQKPQFTDQGTAHILRFRKCSADFFKDWTWPSGALVRVSDCPLVVANGPQNITIYANSDSLPLVAEIDTKAVGSADGPFDAANVKPAAFTIRTVRPYWNLNFSTGFSFFADSKLRDEKYRLVPAADDATTTTIDESKTKPQSVVSAGHGETPYEFGAFATYMYNRPQKAFGLTFGVSTKIPVDQLTAVAGVSWRIKPFPITDSAYLTTGIAYRAHKRLLPKYRETMSVPAGVAESDILESAHDVGLFVAVSFGFGGGDTQFKKVVSGQ